ncbi:hypothetical protein [Sinisalibacter lacisalsi]|uniref:Regulatory protein GemA n=1 Tax=Sinisalibacter lacisalsi TaxID=1526570 RepID=A0ABQ1QS57_9RHOB|nr:hypothetical protein [Sinisalibacter lacisalsi]GGD42107.1 hypothetical protein GCM10011358_27470 [Sinisalibacter lacisalsi]
MTLQLDGARILAAEIQILNEGRFDLVSEMIENDEALSEPLKRLVLAKLNGQFKSKRGPRQNSGKNRLHQEAVRCYLWFLEKEGDEQKDSALGVVGDWFGVNARTVRKWIDKVAAPDLHPLYQTLIALDYAKADALELAKPVAVRMLERSGSKALTRREIMAIERGGYQM